MSPNKTRHQIIAAADQLFYQQGFEHTSFSDIANLVDISRGNFYHHFKTKDDILEAVIDHRLDYTRQLLSEWEALSPDPAERIKSYIRILMTNRGQIKFHGCPVGTLSNELAKLQHHLQPKSREVFTLFRDWLREHFQRLGQGSTADQQAMQVLAWSQGIATLFNAYQDETFVQQEVGRLCDSVDALKPVSET